MGLIKDIRDIQPNNPFNITKDDLTDDLERFSIGVVVKMLEEQEKAGNDLDIEVFKELCDAGSEEGGFTWDKSEDGYNFWSNVINNLKFDEFYKRYPEYKQYDY